MQFIIFGEAFRDRKFDKFPFQCFTTLTAKALFLIAKLQTTSHSLNAFFLLMSLVEMGNSWSPSHVINLSYIEDGYYVPPHLLILLVKKQKKTKQKKKTFNFFILESNTLLLCPNSIHHHLLSLIKVICFLLTLL